MNWTLLYTGEVQERKKILQQIAADPRPEQLRELIRAYEECEWRSTRIDILRVLHHFQSSRSISFLIRVAEEARDAGEVQYALRALARMKHPIAHAAVLRLSQKLGTEDTSAVADALAMIPLPEAKEELLRRFKLFDWNRDPDDLVHLVLALTEHSSEEMLLVFKQGLGVVLQSRVSRELVHALLIAIGGFAHQENDLLEFLPQLEQWDDPFLWASFRQSLQKARNGEKLRPRQNIDWNTESPVAQWLIQVTQNIESTKLDLDFVQVYKANPAEQMDAINAWQLWQALNPSKVIAIHSSKLWESETNISMKARWLRAFSELGLPVSVSFSDFKNSPAEMKQAVFYAWSQPSDLSFSAEWLQVFQEEVSANPDRTGVFLDVLTEKSRLPVAKSVEKFIFEKVILNPALEIKLKALDFFQRIPMSNGLGFVLECSRSEDLKIVLRSVMALGSFRKSPEAVQRLGDFLQHKESAIRGRARDALVRSEIPLAFDLLIQDLETKPTDQELIDLLYRRLKPLSKEAMKSAGDRLQKILNQYPGHLVWDKLVALRDRFGYIESTKVTAEHPLDAAIVSRIPEFNEFEGIMKKAVRAAEINRESAAQHEGQVDLAPVIVEYTKVLDLLLERKLGQNFFFPLIEAKGQEIRTYLHSLGLLEKFVSLEKLLTGLSLNGKFDPEQFPIHKSKIMAASIASGQFLDEKFRILDGLRTWSAVLLIFARGKYAKSSAKENEILDLASRLMKLQDLRNPAAHRQTYLDLKLVDQVRTDAIWCIQKVCAWF